MKKVFSIFLVFTNLFLSKSLICLAEPNEKVTSKKVVTVEKKRKKAEEQKKVEEEVDEVENEAENSKNSSISIEISDETIEKIKEMLNSETNENYAKARLTIDAIFSVILGVNLLCSLKERFFTSPEPVIAEKVQSKTWVSSALSVTKSVFFKVVDKVSTALPFLLLLRYFL